MPSASGRWSRGDIEVLAEPGRFLVATAAWCVARIIGKTVRDGKTSYYITTASTTPSPASTSTTAATGSRRTEICPVFGQTCDGLDTISQSEELPELEIEDLVYSEDIGDCGNGRPRPQEPRDQSAPVASKAS